MPQVTLCTIYCDCEKGAMFKTAVKNEQGEPAMFALVRGTNEDLIQFNALVFQGYCSGCGRKFEFSIWLENLLVYKEVS